MARSLFGPDVDPLGKRIALGSSSPDGPWRTVVGVAGDARYRELQDVRFDLYVPLAQWRAGFVNHFAVRTETDPTNFVASVRREVAAIDPNQAVASVATLEQLVSRRGLRSCCLRSRATHGRIRHPHSVRRARPRHSEAHHRAGHATCPVGRRDRSGRLYGADAADRKTAVRRLCYRPADVCINCLAVNACGIRGVLDTGASGDESGPKCSASVRLMQDMNCGEIVT